MNIDTSEYVQHHIDHRLSVCSKALARKKPHYEHAANQLVGVAMLVKFGAPLDDYRHIMNEFKKHLFKIKRGRKWVFNYEQLRLLEQLCSFN